MLKLANNVSVRVKLWLLVLSMIAALLILGILGFIGISSTDKMNRELYENHTIQIVKSSAIVENLLTASSCFELAMLENGDAEAVAGYNEQFEQLNKATAALLEESLGLNMDTDQRVAHETGSALFYNTFRIESPKIFALLEQGKPYEANIILTGMNKKIGEMVADFTKCKEISIRIADEKSTENSKMANTVMMIQLILMIVGIVWLSILGLSNIVSIIRPVTFLTKLYESIAGSGNLRMDGETRVLFGKFAKRKDEFGKTVKAFNEMLDMLDNKAQILDSVAAGDFTVHVDLKSDKDTMGLSLRTMLEQIRALLGDITAATNRVSTTSRQIAAGSQTLAQGSTEQATTVEELSSSIQQVSQKVDDNAAMAQEAAGFGNTISNNAQTGSNKMRELIAAVQDIYDASKSIKKVIKAIDDIAFQTNILALNASVEAAHAGQEGKGFAVVADEVRNLAGKSADAAHDTNAMINDTLEKVELGARVADETAEALAEIIQGIESTTKVIAEIADSSSQQTQSIAHISVGLKQVSQVVNKNSVTSVEFADASEDMSSQSSKLLDSVSKFKI